MSSLTASSSSVFSPRHSGRDAGTLLFVGNYEYRRTRTPSAFWSSKCCHKVREALPQARLQLVGLNPPDWMRALANDHIEVTGSCA